MLFDTYYIARVKYILYWLCTSWLTCTVLYCTVLACTVLYWLVYSERAAIQEWFSSRNLYEELLHHDY